MMIIDRCEYYPGELISHKQQREKMAEQSSEWSDIELESAVDAYLWMLNEETNGRPYNKAEVNRQLREGVLQDRSRASIEYRMQNISAALEELCLPRIGGYLPAKNIGNNVKDRIRAVLAKKNFINLNDYSPTSDEQQFEAKVKKLRAKPLRGIPRGIKHPEKVTSSVSSFARDPLVKAWVLNQADGKCEGCSQDAPFLSSDGTPYLEVHHVTPLSAGGADEVSNAVALCPNCHRKAHYSSDRQKFIDVLYGRLPRLAK